MKLVVCALIVNDGKLLIVQHGPNTGHPLKWEFPGGKIQPGELHEAALIREVFEELNILITVDMALEPVIYSYPGKDIHLFPFLCRWISGTFILKEHVDSMWIDPEQYADYDMLPADFELLLQGRNYSHLLHYAGKEAKQHRKQDTPTGNRH